MIDKAEGLLGIFKNWREKRKNKDIESIYYISPKETKFFAKKMTIQLKIFLIEYFNLNQS